MTMGKNHQKQLIGLRLSLIAIAALVVSTALAADRETAKHFYSDANNLFDQGRFAEAAAAYGRAIGEDSRYVEAYYNRALANEMVDRAQAVRDWQQFLDAAGDRPEYKWDVARITARIQILKTKPPLPGAMQPGRYLAEAGDYYREVAQTSEGEQWGELPVKVFLASAPQVKWQQGVREAYDIWSAVFPMQLVSTPEKADIRMGWEESVDEVGRAGEESDWVRLQSVGGQLNGRRVAVITVDLSRPWSKDEMRAIILHEFGHALGIKGHSDSKKDIMYDTIQEKSRQLRAPSGAPLPIFWRSLVKDPSPRDINTLIRLYNSAGSIARFD
jgi:predicted Zn-dependent protease